MHLLSLPWQKGYPELPLSLPPHRDPKVQTAANRRAELVPTAPFYAAVESSAGAAAHQQRKSTSVPAGPAWVARAAESREDCEKGRSEEGVSVEHVKGTGTLRRI